MCLQTTEGNRHSDTSPFPREHRRWLHMVHFLHVQHFIFSVIPLVFALVYLFTKEKMLVNVFFVFLVCFKNTFLVERLAARDNVQALAPLFTLEWTEVTFQNKFCFSKSCLYCEGKHAFKHVYIYKKSFLLIYTCKIQLCLFKVDDISQGLHLFFPNNRWLVRSPSQYQSL